MTDCWHSADVDPWDVLFFVVVCIAGEPEHIFIISKLNQQDIEDLDHYEMKEEEPVDGKKSEDDGIEKENLAILEKIRKNQRQDHLNVSPIFSKVHIFWGTISLIFFTRTQFHPLMDDVEARI